MTVIGEVTAPIFVNHSASQLGLTDGDLEYVKQFVSMALQAFPYLHYTVDELITEGDKIVARLTISGVQQGAFMGMHPNSKHATITDIEIFRITGGKTVENRVQADFLGLVQRLCMILLMR